MHIYVLYRIGEDDLHKRTQEFDCDGDGNIDPLASKACRSSHKWYAEVGQFGCVIDETGEKVCSASRAESMSKLGEWTPSDWEWIVDFSYDKESNHSYVLTNG